ncbi:hypothetical protein PHYBLDRAFT_150402 [Phycomyces blakesleeanus NRRL 1555(-)]|uniref:DDE Tnp4 domain-containing protein n=1 Tax=Phycomyces blakesleeanus (strain ATCC 8743b / DSM 1359 / FGSC 10004 / NBRC 33097 / NRRL 1555) TaxID=763407 RepID=A0A162N7Q3_PHYB8|nr:hypothetical protein PHYBLDRAFT_152384 [Phycomyces blakesleeanus NRRL 1555(-)]XP_018286850.1 hypothetical protein PHYBLDRAFT_150402 [Phycomyces blakesleeanus NRRL 1555(-)]OAD66584.1 hypothetical protein PHYBLDRAFT_152384 [Phycomyces blakesleeanus NRRL 1555(-)]OAD68810.1 hypothetical protein PHYBLDRAFT_150402 [Phycomyces blakesleeanus NRRL 1555(-)]|eukprot:XP_018284624.1 hypothetical protein PHYBLDRAFT_152384 [Phycomyces blakesleeanus NRRL 1555(-)]
MPHTPINILAKSTLDASAAITQHTLKKMIKMLSGSNVIACEEYHDTYEDFASICKLKLQQEKLMVTKAQDKISKGRYFFKRQNKIKKLVTQKKRLNFLLALDESGFLEELQMSKSSFYKLYDLVKNHKLYQQLSGFDSINVRLQISIVLDQLGSNGNSLSSGHLARCSGIGKQIESSIENITTRFFKDFQTLLDFLADAYLSWQKHYCESQSSFSVTDLLTVFFGSLHDMCTLSECELGKFPEQFFSDDKYMLADARYKATNYIVPIKKKLRNSELSLADQKFNTKILSMHLES